MARRRSPGIVLDPVQLRLQLAVRGLRQDEVAQLAGLTPSTISKACSHGGPLTATSLGRLARALRSVEPDPLALQLLAPRPGSPTTFARIASALASAPEVAQGAERLLSRPGASSA